MHWGWDKRVLGPSTRWRGPTTSRTSVFSKKQVSKFAVNCISLRLIRVSGPTLGGLNHHM